MDRLVGLTTEGNKVFAIEEEGVYLIEGRYEGQFWKRTYSECYQWVEFFQKKTRAEHSRLLKI